MDMREKFLFTLIGFVIGIILAAALYNFYVSSIPEATDMDKSLVLLIGIFVVIGTSYIGFRIGEDP
jgi:hypothetical protein